MSKEFIKEVFIFTSAMIVFSLALAYWDVVSVILGVFIILLFVGSGLMFLVKQFKSNKEE